MTTKVANGLDLQNQRIQAVADPSSNTDAANKQYVDNKAVGLSWKQPVRVSTTTNGTLASAYANGSSVDGITLVTGDRILLKDQTAQTENGIYTVNASGAPTRGTDADVSVELLNATVFIIQGSTNADRAYTQTSNAAGGTGPVIGSDNITFVQFGGGITVTAGNGLTGTTTLSVLANGTSIDVSASGVKIADAAAGAGLTAASGILAVGAGTGITVAADSITVDNSVVVRKFAASIGDGTTTTYVVTHNLGTTDITVGLHEVSSGASWLPDITARATNTVTLVFATAPASNFFRVVVHA